MMEEHGAGWPLRFAETMQAVIARQQKDAAVAAFSEFMYSETHRCLKGDAVALSLK